MTRTHSGRDGAPRITVLHTPEALLKKGVYGAAVTAGPSRLMMIPASPRTRRLIATVFHELLHLAEHRLAGPTMTHDEIRTSAQSIADAWLASEAPPEGASVHFPAHHRQFAYSAIRHNLRIADALKKGRRHVLA